MLLGIQTLAAALTFKATRGSIPWIVVVLILGSNLIILVRIEYGRGNQRAERKAQRKIQTLEILKRITAGMAGPLVLSEQQVQTIRTQVLATIASNVGSFFYDFTTTKTSAALLVLRDIQVGDKTQKCLTVVAREIPVGAPRNILDVENYIAYRTITLGWLHSTGNIDWEYPQLVGKSYKSVLSLPLKLDTGEVVGAVNVQSSRRFHFSERELLFETNLSPYLALMAMTFKAQPAATGSGALNANN